MDATTPVTFPADVPELLRHLADAIENGTPEAGQVLLLGQHMFEALADAIPSSPEIQQVYTLAEYVRL